MNDIDTLAAHSHVEGTDQPMERLFYPGADGYVFAATRFNSRLQLPFYGMVSISLDGRPIRIEIGGQSIEQPAMAFWARDVRFVDPSVSFVTIGINPFHPLFRAFTKIPERGAVPLDYARFAPFASLMRQALLSKHFTQKEALTLHRGVLAVARQALPQTPLLNPRAQTLMRMLCEKPRSSLGELAEGLQLSYHRTSHLFTQAVGITVRTYQLWQKLYRAGEPLMRRASLTDVAHAAGFVDSAHFSNAFQTAYGRSPTDMFKTRRIIVLYRDAFTETAIGETLRMSAAS